MMDLIEAFKIFLKYGNPDYPTHCEHDVLWIVGIEWDQISEQDQKRLDELGFHYDEDDDSIKSFKYGSA